MGEEVDKRVMEAADALVAAFDGLREAKLALDDPRLSSSADQQRNQGFSQAANRTESAARKAEEALRRALVAAAVRRNPADFACYRLADGRLAGARAEWRSAAREEDASGKAARLSIAVALLEQGLDAAKDLIFGEAPAADAAANGSEGSAAMFVRGAQRPLGG